MLYHKELSDEIIGAFYEVYQQLGYGFAERVYQNALYFELRDRGLRVDTQQKSDVYFKGKHVGSFYSDMIVNDTIILELKVFSSISEAHERQLLNYLKSSKIEIGYVLNFGKEPEFSRKILSNWKKPHLKQ